MHLIKFHLDYGPSGGLPGTFLVNAEGLRRLTALIETVKYVEFGEVLGKHPDVYEPVRPDDVTIIPLTDEAAAVVLTAFNATLNTWGWATLSGYNPLDYASPEDPGDAERADDADDT